MTSLDQLQAEHKVWGEHNFPDAPSHQFLLGAMEEVGELAHVHLKDEQGIRTQGTPAQVKALKADAIGDLFIFLAGYCNREFLSLQECIDVTWARVKQRDWQADPVGGGE